VLRPWSHSGRACKSVGSDVVRHAGGERSPEVRMSLTLQDVLPNLASGLANTGFFFGAGTSVEAGYPTMPRLTRDVIGRLNSGERGVLEECLAASTLAYDESSATPNIEVIADVVLSHAITTGHARFSQLEERLRTLITQVIVGVTDPVLDNHVRFLSALRHRAFGRPACVYVFTTNYDVLFELAAAESGVVVETGFAGAVERFFDHQRFGMSCGVEQAQGRFSEHAALTVRLIKLHGSISWIARAGNVFERHPAAIADSDRRVMILPRRRKVMDTLQAPHGALFTVASRALGNDCKYLVSCGFSFGDDHINTNLLVPSVAAGKVRLFALADVETPGMAPFNSLPAFSAGFESSGISEGTPNGQGTDFWKFSRFVRLFD
jgi:hypothetical protein